MDKLYPVPAVDGSSLQSDAKRGSDSSGGPLSVACYILIATALTSTIAIQGWLLLHQEAPLGMDEGYIAAFALRMINGQWLPHVDAVSHRGPLLYWMAAVAQWLCGPYRWIGIRALSALLGALSALACCAVGFVVKRPFAGAMSAALLVYTLCAGTLLTSGMSLNGELAAAPFAIGSVALTSWALVREQHFRRRIVILGAAGFLASAAALCKQTASLNIGPLLLWCVAAGWSAPGRTGVRRWWESGVLAAGSAIPLISVAAIYASHHELRALWYWSFQYNAQIYMEPYKGLSGLAGVADWWAQSQVALPLTGCALAALFMLGSIWSQSEELRPAALLRAYAKHGIETTVALLVMLGLIGALAPLRMFPHYFILVYPWLSLFVGLRTDRLCARVKHGSTALRNGTAMLVASFIFVGVLARLNFIVTGASRIDFDSDPLCRVIQSRSGLKDSILVWGFDGDVYVSCHRRPATKFVYSTLVMGVVPPRFGIQNDRWVVPNARAQAAVELKQERPALIVENATFFGGRRITAIPELARTIRDEYCFPFEQVGYGPRTFLVYSRKDLGCPSSEVATR